MNAVAEFWNGKRPLAQAFWLVWVLGGILFGLLLWLLIVAGLSWFPAMITAVIAIASLALLSFQVYCYVSVWRCAVNVKARVWMVIARVLVVLSALQLALFLVRTNGLIYAPVSEAFGQFAN